MASKKIDIQMRTRGEKQAEAKMKSLGTSVASTVAQYASLAIVGAGALKFFKSSIEASIKQEQIFRKLATAVKLAGGNYDSIKVSLQGYFAELQKTTEYGDTQSAAALTTLIQLTGDYDAALKNLPLVLDVAASGLFDMNTVARMMGQTIGGAPEIWGRYIGELKSTSEGMKNLKTPTEKAEFALKILNEKFSGTAQENVKSYAGEISQLGNKFEDLQEKLGDQVLKLGELSGGFSIGMGIIESYLSKITDMGAQILILKLLFKDNKEGIEDWQGWLDTGFEKLEEGGKTIEKILTPFQKWVILQNETAKETEKIAGWQLIYNQALLEQLNIGQQIIEIDLASTYGIMAEHAFNLSELTEDWNDNLEFTSKAAEGIINKYRKIEQVGTQVSFILADSFRFAFQGGEDAMGRFLESFQRMLESMVAQIMARAVIFTLLQAIGLPVGGPGGGGLLQNIFGFQHGGSFQVGGSGGADSQLVAFRASPGERVTITPENQTTNNNINITFVNPIMDKRHTEQQILPMIKKAIRQNYQ